MENKKKRNRINEKLFFWIAHTIVFEAHQHRMLKAHTHTYTLKNEKTTTGIDPSIPSRFEARKTVYSLTARNFFLIAMNAGSA